MRCRKWSDDNETASNFFFRSIINGRFFLVQWPSFDSRSVGRCKAEEGSAGATEVQYDRVKARSSHSFLFSRRRLNRNRLGWADAILSISGNRAKQAGEAGEDEEGGRWVFISKVFSAEEALLLNEL